MKVEVHDRRKKCELVFFKYKVSAYMRIFAGFSRESRMALGFSKF